MTSTPPPLLYDLFLDIPHPAASKNCPSPQTISPPPGNDESVSQEFSEEKSVGRITRFAFPEFDDRVHAEETAKNPLPPPSPASANLNRYDIYIQNFIPSTHVFSLQRSNGSRIYGHVCRYLPAHDDARSRVDVGRRGIRAMVILTRVMGGESFYEAVLKTMVALSAQHPSSSHINISSITTFLYSLHHPKTTSNLTISNLEISSPLFTPLDTLTLTPPKTTTTPILPLLRTLGPSHTLRLLSAILTERRIIFTSKRTSILSTCLHSTIALLQTGLLTYPHVFIPILPPHLVKHLAAPIPYLIGVLDGKLGNVDELGEVLVCDLDRNKMNVYGFRNVGSCIPDLLRGSMNDGDKPFTSTAEILAQDLLDILSTDRRLFAITDTLSTTLTAAAKKSNLLVKSALEKMRRATRQDSSDDTTNPADESLDQPQPDMNFDDYGPNEGGEEDARVAFTSFFLSLYGDWGWYLSNRNGVPAMDRDKYLQSRKRMGDVQGTPMYPLVGYFSQSTLFEQFCGERIREIGEKRSGDTLFHQCMSYHRKQQCDFSLVNVRRITKQVAQNRSDREGLQRRVKIKALAMGLTSNARYEGDVPKAVAKLAEECREINGALAEVMGVVWYRIRDSQGGQWKHALLALVLLRNLLLHGPITVVAEATDNIGKVFRLKHYNSNRANGEQIRKLAGQVYGLISDRAKLFAQRRYCAWRRRLLKFPPKVKLVRDGRLKLNEGFKKIHGLLKPKMEMEIKDLLNVNTEASANKSIQEVIVSSSYTSDLLSFDFCEPTTAPSASTASVEVTSSIGGVGTSFDSSSDTAADISSPFDVSEKQSNKAPSVSDLLDIFNSSLEANPTTKETSFYSSDLLAFSAAGVTPFDSSQEQKKEPEKELEKQQQQQQQQQRQQTQPKNQQQQQHHNRQHKHETFIQQKQNHSTLYKSTQSPPPIKFPQCPTNSAVRSNSAPIDQIQPAAKYIRQTSDPFEDPFDSLYPSSDPIPQSSSNVSTGSLSIESGTASEDKKTPTGKTNSYQHSTKSNASGNTMHPPTKPQTNQSRSGAPHPTSTAKTPGTPNSGPPQSSSRSHHQQSPSHPWNVPHSASTNQTWQTRQKSVPALPNKPSDTSHLRTHSSPNAATHNSSQNVSYPQQTNPQPYKGMYSPPATYGQPMAHGGYSPYQQQQQQQYQAHHTNPYHPSYPQQQQSSYGQQPQQQPSYGQQQQQQSSYGQQQHQYPANRQYAHSAPPKQHSLSQFDPMAKK